MEETRNAYTVFAVKSLGKRQLGKLRKWDDNIKRDIREIVKSVGVGQERYQCRIL
jgi:hypothetical protein